MKTMEITDRRRTILFAALTAELYRLRAYRSRFAVEKRQEAAQMLRELGASEEHIAAQMRE